MPIHSQPSIHLGAPGEEISRKSLHLLARRFLHLHRQRLNILSRCLNRRQRDCLEILPLLFHHNHPALPGFCDGLAPAGISDYRAPAPTRQAIKRISPGFDYRRRGIPEAPILALFLMGSVGSVAWSEKSDLDLWVCHRSDLDLEALANLERKCRGIERWADDNGLEIHCFLVDPEKLRQGKLPPLSGESSGSTQHILLLEEFYRTAIHLAGHRLLWWLIPPEQEHHYREYADYLLGKRFIDSASFIDLGGLDNVPAHEFVSAGMWHLYKALDSPYKALLKLQLLLSYAAEYPEPRWIADGIKQEIYAGRLGPSRLDPYIRLYEKVEDFLIEQGQTDLLTLVQRGFIMKTHHALQQPHLRFQIENLLHNWGWQTNRGVYSQLHPHTFEALHEEWHTLIEALKLCYQTLRRFHLTYESGQGEDQEDLRLLGRKLNAVLEKRPGKVEVVQLTTPVDLTETALIITKEIGNNQVPRWVLRRGKNRGTLEPPLLQTRHLIEAITWAQANHIADLYTHWNVEANGTALYSAELRFLSQAIRHFLATHSKPRMEVYRSRAKILRVALFPNIATPTRPQRGHYEITSERFDPLAYGADRHVLIRHLEALVFNSWGELHIKQYDGLEGLFDCLCLLYDQAGPALPLQAHCFASRTIAMRIAELYQALAKAFSDYDDVRFVLGAGNSYYLFQRINGALGWWEVGDEKALVDSLGQSPTGFGKVVFDRHTLDHSPLTLLYKHNLAGKIQLFIHPLKQGMEIFVLDERGALFHQSHPDSPFQSVIQRYIGLFEALDRRYAGNHTWELYRLEKEGSGWKIHKLDSAPEPETAIDVRIYAEDDPGTTYSYTLVCNGREFSSTELDEEVFSKAASYIRQLRQGKAGYPLYVSDIDVPPNVLGLSSPTMVHTALLLKYKHKLEQRLNQ